MATTPDYIVPTGEYMAEWMDDEGINAADYVHRLPRRRDLIAIAIAIATLATELGVAPSIVLGRAQREAGDYRWGHMLKKRVDWGSERS